MLGVIRGAGALRLRADWRAAARASVAVALIVVTAAGCARTTTATRPDLGTAAPLAAPTAAERAAARRVGERVKPQILAQFGGVYPERRVSAYVDRIGARLVASSGLRAADRWTFTVLDTGEINAFATPGGFVYVTRGILALANDESDVAAVVGHELGHIERQHGRQRSELLRRVGEIRDEARAQAEEDGVDLAALDREFQQLSQLVLARFSQEQELQADADGIRFAARAGYDPAAQERMLRRMQAQVDLDARAVGVEAAQRRMRFLSTHPATPERLTRARTVATAALPQARAAGFAADDRATRAAHLDAVDGLEIGDDDQQGFVRGRAFIHPSLDFRFEAPPGFVLSNSRSSVTARAPDDRLIIFDGRPNAGGPLEQYVRRDWSEELRAQFGDVAALGPIAPFENRAFPALSTSFQIETRRGPAVVRLVAIAAGDTIYRLTAISDAAAADAMATDLRQMTRSFRRLSPAEKTAEQADRIRVVTARPGDGVATLAASLPYERFKRERFRILNGLDAGQQVRPGDRIKLVERF